MFFRGSSRDLWSRRLLKEEAEHFSSHGYIQNKFVSIDRAWGDHCFCETTTEIRGSVFGTVRTFVGWGLNMDFSIFRKSSLGSIFYFWLRAFKFGTVIRYTRCESMFYPRSASLGQQAFFWFSKLCTVHSY